ncbi:MAG: hypothetical protein GEV08_23190 [Acidimicrobiia bacterium]|nr:hypothetical protein [Acidimicrobiia bacterium]
MSPASLDLGVSGGREVVLLGNDGSTALEVGVAAATPFNAAPNAATVPAGGSVEVLVTVARDGLPEGDLSGTLTITHDSGATLVPLGARVEHAPFVRLPEGDATIFSPGARVCGPITVAVAATVGDESPVRAVELRWEGPRLGRGALALRDSGDGRNWVGQLGPFATSGTASYVVVATDARGNEGTGGPRQLFVRPCPD